MDEQDYRRENDRMILQVLNQTSEMNIKLDNVLEKYAKLETTMHGETGNNGVCGTLKTVCAKVESTQMELTEHKVDDDKAHTRISEEMKWILGTGLAIMAILLTVFELISKGVIRV